MLTYESIMVGQRVEVLRNDQVLYGTVLYKGQVVGRRGIWIGVDLSTPDGDNDGSIKGRVYFRAPMNYGIFTTIDYIRVASTYRRRWRSTYRTVNKKSVVEEELFGNTHSLHAPVVSTDASISNAKVARSLKKPNERSKSAYFNQDEKRYPLPQTFAKQYDDKIKKQRELQSLLDSQVVDTTEFTFSPTPSISRVHMPPSEVDRVKRTGFAGMSIPRFTVVYDQKDFIE